MLIAAMRKCKRYFSQSSTTCCITSGIAIKVPLLLHTDSNGQTGGMSFQVVEIKLTTIVN